MPTVAELERLGALVSLLTPLTEVNRGEPIRAQDWNTVVGVLVEVARVVLAEERESVPPPHDHPDQVSVGWLDSRLRSLVERGPLTDPAAVSRVSTLERNIGRLTDRVEEVDGATKENRIRITDVATRDVTREAEVNTIRRELESAASAKDDVLALRETLRSIEENVGVAMEVGSRLIVNDEPVDMAAFDQRLKSLEVLQERLRMPTGELLDAATLEIRLTELTNTLVTEDELDTILEDLPSRIEPEQVEALEEKLRAELLDGVEISMARLAKEVQAETSKRLAEVDTQIAQAVSDALPGLSESVLASARLEISAAVQKAGKESQAYFEKRLDETEAVLHEDLNQQIKDIQRNIGSTVRTEFERQLPTHLGPIETNVTNLSTRIEQAEATLVEHDERITNLGTRMEVILRDSTSAQVELHQTLIGEMESRDAAVKSEVQDQLSQASEIIKEQVDAIVANAQRTLVEEVRKAASDAAATEARIVANQLRGEMRATARDEVAALQSQIRGTVAAEVEQALMRLPGLVSQEVRRATANLSELVRAEFDAFQPTLNLRVDQSLRDQGASMVEVELKRLLREQPELAPPPQADFTRIDGIGPTFDQRLKAANVRTFADLAAMTPEDIAETLDTSVGRVITYDIVGQAKQLAGLL